MARKHQSSMNQPKKHPNMFTEIHSHIMSKQTKTIHLINILSMVFMNMYYTSEKKIQSENYTLTVHSTTAEVSTSMSYKKNPVQF